MKEILEVRGDFQMRQLDLDDLEHTARLLAAFAQSLGEEGAGND